MDLFPHGKSRWRDRECPAEIIRVRHPPHVPELEKDLPSGLVNGPGHVPPPGSLLWGVNTGSPLKTNPLGAYLRSFRYDKSR